MTTENYSAISEKAKELLGDAELSKVIDARTARGVKKYGHTLDEYTLPPAYTRVNEVQELLDAMQYALKAGDQKAAESYAELIHSIMDNHPEITPEMLLYEEHGQVNWKEEFRSLVVAVLTTFGAPEDADPYEVLCEYGDKVSAAEQEAVKESHSELTEALDSVMTENPNIRPDTKTAITQAFMERQEELRKRAERIAKNRKRWNRQGDDT